MIDLNFSVTLNTPDGELAVIRAHGADAGRFLQGQLTQDVLLMKPAQARLAAWCSANGRMLATLIVFKAANDEFLLMLSRDLLAATLKRLKMFVLRAQCELTEVSDQYALEGLLGTFAQEATQPTSSVAPSAVLTSACSANSSEMRVSLPTGWLQGRAVPRALRIRPQALATSSVANADAAQIAAWNAMEITSGVARLSAAVSEAFVPQMLNYESVGGVNFKKGCYPGQEVVARSQFRGTLKRRGYIVTSPDALHAGQEVFDSRQSEQPCGQVAQAAAHPAGGFIAIVSMQVAAQDSPALHVGSPDGALLQLQALPYALLEDV
jgi:tRNA-modifying protein YgfZ